MLKCEEIPVGASWYAVGDEEGMGGPGRALESSFAGEPLRSSKNLTPVSYANESPTQDLTLEAT